MTNAQQAKPAFQWDAHTGPVSDPSEIKIEADGVFHVAGVVMEIRFHGKVAHQDQLDAWLRQVYQQIVQGQIALQTITEE